MTIEYLGAEQISTFEVNLRVNGNISTIMSKWDHILFRKWIAFIHNIIISSNLTNVGNAM